MSKVIVVDKKDTPLYLKDKLECHLGKGILHRAFSVFVFNKNGELLLQQRSEDKFLWPLYWSNTCCSHPYENESYEAAARRRLKEEMGFYCNPRLIGSFVYQANYKDKGTEYELCSVLLGEYNGIVNTDPEEVANWKWMDLEKVKKDVVINPDIYTPWFKIELENFYS